MFTLSTSMFTLSTCMFTLSACMFTLSTCMFILPVDLRQLERVKQRLEINTFGFTLSSAVISPRKFVTGGCEFSRLVMSEFPASPDRMVMAEMLMDGSGLLEALYWRLPSPTSSLSE